MLIKRTLLALTLVIALVISTVAIIWLVKPHFPKTITVPDDYSTIQEAIDNASAGDIVFVKKGTYNAQGFKGINISKPLSLVGEDSQETIIQSEATGRYYGTTSTIQISADEVTVKGFTIIGIGDMGEVGIGLGGSRCKIIGNNILNHDDAGIGAGGSNNYIFGNNITDNGSFGISMSSLDSKIIGNNIERNTEGIFLESAENIIIKQNNIVHNGLGGVKLEFNGHYNVYQNNIADNSGYGVLFRRNCGNSIIHDNNIARNQIGIDLFNFDAPFGVDNIVYSNNLINNSANAVVEHAYYIHNRSPTYENGTDVVAWDNGFVGNYWSDYDGQGTYVIDENNVDRHPLTHQVDISITAPELSTIIVTIAIVFIVAIVGVGLLVYSMKRKR